jgi:hypothetical protein
VRATGRFELQTRLSRGLEPEERARRKALLAALDDVARLATTAQNVGMRENWRADSAILDAILSEHGQVPRGTKIEWARAYSYPAMRRAAPRLSSNVAATLQRDVDRKWCQERWDVLIRQTRSCPHYRMGQPVPIPSAGVTLSRALRQDDSSVIASFAIFSGEHDGERRLSVVLCPRDDYQKSVLDHLVDGSWRLGRVTLEQDRLRPDRWFLKLAYKRLVAKRLSGKACGINRGIRFFLAAVAEGGEEWIYDGADIEAFLKQVQRRRRSYQNQVSASARTGHGRTRTLVPIEQLAGKAERWRRTRCQVIARRFAEWCAARGIARVYVEDFSGIRDGEPDRIGERNWIRVQEWPYYQLEQRIRSCLEERGIQVETVSARWISETCPSCGHVDPANTDLARWRIRCTRCRRSRHLDLGAAANVLARGEAAREPPDPSRDVTTSHDAAARKPRSKSTKKKGTNGAGGKL